MPDYFQNNITWVKTGAITQQAFLDSYYYLANEGVIHTAPTEPIIEEPIIQLPELLPEVEAQIEPICLSLVLNLLAILKAPWIIVLAKLLVNEPN